LWAVQPAHGQDPLREPQQVKHVVLPRGPLPSWWTPRAGLFEGRSRAFPGPRETPACPPPPPRPSWIPPRSPKYWRSGRSTVTRAIRIQVPRNDRRNVNARPLPSSFWQRTPSGTEPSGAPCNERFRVAPSVSAVAWQFFSTCMAPCLPEYGPWPDSHSSTSLVARLKKPSALQIGPENS